MTVESALLDDMKKSADDYRRKDLFEFRAYNATRVELTRGSDTVVLERVKGQGRASSFVDASAKTGLDKPVMTIVVKFDEGKKEDRATFGQVGNDVFVSRPGEPGAAKIDTTDFNELMKSLDEIGK